MPSLPPPTRTPLATLQQGAGQPTGAETQQLLGRFLAVFGSSLRAQCCICCWVWGVPSGPCPGSAPSTPPVSWNRLQSLPSNSRSAPSVQMTPAAFTPSRVPSSSFLGPGTPLANTKVPWADLLLMRKFLGSLSPGSAPPKTYNPLCAQLICSCCQGQQCCLRGPGDSSPAGTRQLGHCLHTEDVPLP